MEVGSMKSTAAYLSTRNKEKEVSRSYVSDQGE